MHVISRRMAISSAPRIMLLTRRGPGSLSSVHRLCHTFPTVGTPTSAFLQNLQTPARWNATGGAGWQFLKAPARSDQVLLGCVSYDPGMPVEHEGFFAPCLYLRPQFRPGENQRGKGEGPLEGERGRVPGRRSTCCGFAEVMGFSRAEFCGMNIGIRE